MKMAWQNIGGPGGGAAQRIFPGNSTAVYGTDSEGNIWQYDGTGSTWTLIGGPGSTFAADGGTIYGLTPNKGGVWRYTGTPLAWDLVHDAAENLYSSINEGVGLYAEGPNGGDIFAWSPAPQPAGTWTSIGGPGNQWVVGATGMYGLTSNNQSVFQYTGVPGEWIKIGAPTKGVNVIQLFTHPVAVNGGLPFPAKLYATDSGGIHAWNVDSGTDNPNWVSVGQPASNFACTASHLYGLNSNKTALWVLDNLGSPGSDWVQIADTSTIGDTLQDIAGAASALFLRGGKAVYMWDDPFESIGG